jgi:hypothetical protein
MWPHERPIFLAGALGHLLKNFTFKKQDTVEA